MDAIFPLAVARMSWSDRETIKRIYKIFEFLVAYNDVKKMIDSQKSTKVQVHRNYNIHRHTVG